MFSKRLIGAVALSAGSMFGGAAHATVVLFDNVGDSYTANYVYTIDGANLDASVTYRLDAWTAGTATFDITITNNTGMAQPGQNAITAFGIDIVAPELTGATDNSATWVADINKTFPGFQKVDFCAGTNGCSGGNIQEGVFEQKSLNFDAFLTTNGDFTKGITFTSPFVTKWQGVGLRGGSWELDANCPPGTPGCDPRPPQEIPEPGTLALAGLAALGLGLFRRRKRV